MSAAPRRRALSRRRFLALIAAGSAAVATPAAAATAPAAKRKAPGPAPPPANVRAEIDKQKKYVADALAKIRGYELPPGSDMAFVFRPLQPRRRRS